MEHLDTQLYDGDQMQQKLASKLPSLTEQRKQRNRQAQAAFRERRTYYIKDLEEEAAIRKTEIKRLEDARTQAVDECLMLRYKNSLLERILLEKDIDVKAELRMKEDANLELVTSSTKQRRNHMQPDDTSASGILDQCDGKSSSQRRKRSKHSTPLQLNTPESLRAEMSPVALSPPCATAYSPAGSVSTTSSIPDNHDTYHYTPRQSISNIPYIDEDSVLSSTGDSVLKLLSGGKIGSTRNTAEFYLTSFLAHIETLEKEAQHNSKRNTTNQVHAAGLSDSSHPRQQQQHIPSDCQRRSDRINRKRHRPDTNDSNPAPESLATYDPMSYMKPFDLDACLQFPTQFNF